MKLKTKINVLKKEAKQICFNEVNKFIPNHYGLKDNKDNILCIYNSRLIFDFGFLTCLDYDSIYENYKNYEWRLTDLKDLEQGDVCRYIINDLPHTIFVFDKIIDEEQQFGWFWCIENKRPRGLVIARSKVYKLFKRSDKK